MKLSSYFLYRIIFPLIVSGVFLISSPVHAEVYSGTGTSNSENYSAIIEVDPLAVPLSGPTSNGSSPSSSSRSTPSATPTVPITSPEAQPTDNGGSISVQAESSPSPKGTQNPVTPSGEEKTPLQTALSSSQLSKWVYACIIGMIVLLILFLLYKRRKRRDDEF